MRSDEKYQEQLLSLQEHQNENDKEVDVQEVSEVGGSVVESEMRKSWMQRTFGPLEPGSVRGSIFTLLSTALGVGILTLPHVLLQNGMILGGLMIMLGAFVCVWSMHLLNKTSFKTGIVEYNLLIGKCFGRRFKTLFEGVIVFYSFGSLVGYQITLAEIFPIILQRFGIPEEIAETENLRTIQIAAFALIIFPIALIKNLSGLRYFTLIGVGATIYILGILAFQTPSFHSHFWVPEEANYWKLDINAITNFGVTIFAFTCHTNIFPVRAELSNPSESRLQKIFNRFVFSLFLLDMMCAFCGYLSMGPKTPDVIIRRQGLDDNDYVMLSALIAFTFGMMITITVNVTPCRSQINYLLDKEPTNCAHVVITACIIFGSAFVAIVYPKLLTLFSFIGGSCSVMLVITFPAATALKTSKRPLTSWSNLINLIFMIVLTTIGFTGSVISLLETFGIIDPNGNSDIIVT